MSDYWPSIIVGLFSLAGVVWSRRGKDVEDLRADITSIHHRMDIRDVKDEERHDKIIHNLNNIRASTTAIYEQTRPEE